MTLSMRRIVLFTKDMPGMVKFYRDVLGLKLKKGEKSWKEFDANGCVIALHNAGRPRRQDVQADDGRRAGALRRH